MPRGYNVDYDQDEESGFSSILAERRNPAKRNNKRNNSLSLLSPMANVLENNILMEDEEEEYVCLSGDEEDAERWHKIMQEPHKDCGVGCKSHGTSKELEEIESIHDKSYGKRSDISIYKEMADDYNRRIYVPQNDQKKILEKIEKRKLEDIPEWTTDEVRRHIENDTINVFFEIGRDIKRTRTFQSHLEFNQVAKKARNGKRYIVQDSIELWMKLSKHKADLCTKLDSMDKKKNLDTFDNKKISKPSGTRS